MTLLVVDRAASELLQRHFLAPVGVLSLFCSFQNTISQTAGCPLSQKVLFMGVASDCEYTKLYGSPQNATTQILTNWNTASALYKVHPFKVLPSQYANVVHRARSMSVLE